MRYPYRCANCAREWDVVKAVADIDRDEPCDCGELGTRYIARTHFYGASDWDSAEFNHGLGCVVRNGRHRRELAKSMGLEEIGNERVEKIHDHYDSLRADKRKKRWESV